MVRNILLTQPPCPKSGHLTADIATSGPGALSSALPTQAPTVPRPEFPLSQPRPSARSLSSPRCLPQALGSGRASAWTTLAPLPDPPASRPPPASPSPSPPGRACVLVAQLSPTLFDPMSYSRPGSSVHGILQTKILEWVAIPFIQGPLQSSGSQTPGAQAASPPLRA